MIIKANTCIELKILGVRFLFLNGVINKKNVFHHFMVRESKCYTCTVTITIHLER